MGHSSMNKKRKCDEKPSPEQVDLTNPSFENSTSIIPPSIDAFSEERNQVINCMISSIIYKL